MIKLIICHISIVISVGVNAATFTPIGTKNQGVTLIVSGRLDQNDGSKFASSVKQTELMGASVTAVSLNSPGGAVLAGAAIARLVKEKRMISQVADGNLCASACFMIFAAGKERQSGKNSQIGVHSAVEPGLGETDGAKSSTIDMVRFLSELDVPPQILGKLVTAKPNEMSWLTADDLQALRVQTIKEKLPPGGYIEKTIPKIDPTALPSIVTNEQKKEAFRLMVDANGFSKLNNQIKSLELLRRARQLNPYDPDIAIAIGETLYKNGNLDEAKNVLLLASQLKPTYYDTYRMIGILAAELNDESWTNESYEKFIKYSSNKGVALSYLEMLTTNGRTANVRELTKKYLKSKGA